MFKAVIETLKYIRDIPVELTEKAVLAGELRKGSVVGLIVHPVTNPCEEVLIEVQLRADLQAELIKPNLKVTLLYYKGRYQFSPEWRQYIPREQHSPESKPKGESKGGSRLRPPPGCF